LKRQIPRRWSLLATLACLALVPAALHRGVGARASVPDAAAPDSRVLSLVEDLAFEEVLSRSFEAILSDSQLGVYASLGDAERAVYRRRFWNANDPTPATERNEFLEEHLGRLEYALETFCDGDGVEWDDRGDVALRYGVPPARSQTIGDFSLAYCGRGIEPPSEVWTYPRMGMSIRFIDPNLDGRYVIGEDTKHYSARGRPTEVGGGVTGVPRVPDGRPAIPALVPTDVEALHAATQAQSHEAEGRRALAEVPVSYGYAAPAEPIPLYYEVVTAKGTGGATDVAINYQLPMDCVRFEGAGRALRGRITKRVRVMSTDHDVLTADARTVDLTFEGGGVEREEELITDEWRLDTVPGEYVFTISVEDTTSGRAGYGMSRVVVPDYSTDGLSMSDVLIASSVGDGGRFVRRGGAVVPQPIRAFRRAEELVVYVELYGLSGDRAGRSYFSVTTEVSGLGYEGEKGWLSRFVSRLFPEGQHAVSSRVDAWGDAPDTAYWFSLSLANLAEDNYDVTVTVRDLVGGGEVSRHATFTVLE